MVEKKAIENRIEILFKAIYFILTILSFNIFCARQSYLTYLSYVVVGIGFCVALFRFTHIKDFLNTKIWILVIFVMSYAAAAIHTIQYGYMENVQAIIWMFIQYFLIFAVDKNRDKRVLKDEFKVLSIIFLTYTFLVAVAGFVMVITNWGHYKEMDGLIFAVGFIWNRLWGCYVDPNYGAIFSIISILLSKFYYKASDNKWLRFALIINIIFEYLYICYSDSRTGRLAILLSFTTYFYLVFIRKESFKVLKKEYVLYGFKKIAVSGVMAFVISGILLGGVYVVKNATSIVNTTVAKATAISSGASEEEAEYIADVSRIGRHEDEINGGDVSNNRFDIWRSAFDIYKANPIVGVSFRNIMAFAREKQPDGFISTSGFTSMHNAFIDILVSQGTIGIILIAILVFLVLKEVFTKAKLINCDAYAAFATMFACIVAIMVSMMVYSETFYMNTGGAFIFWYFLGLIVNYMLIKEDTNGTEESSLL